MSNPTILCIETLISAKQAINDKLQGSVATYLKCGGVVNNQIKKKKMFKIVEYLAKLQARTWLSHALRHLEVWWSGAQRSGGIAYNQFIPTANLSGNLEKM